MTTTNTKTPIVPQAGMAATYCCGSDSYPYTIHEVDPKGKKLWASADQYEFDRTGQTEGGFIYTNVNANDRSKWEEYRLAKNGRWVLKGTSQDSFKLAIGHRRFYQNPSF